MQANNGASQCQQGEMDIKSSLKTNAQLAKPCQPSMGSFYYPAMTTPSLVAFDTASGNARLDPPSSQIPTSSQIITATVKVIAMQGHPDPRVFSPLPVCVQLGWHERCPPLSCRTEGNIRIRHKTYLYCQYWNYWLIWFVFIGDLSC